MRKIMSLLVCLVLVVACKKTAAPPAPPPVNNVQSQPNLSQQEQQLVGLWLMDSMVTYINNTRTGFASYSNTLTCRMKFGSDKSLEDGHAACSLTQQLWNAPNLGSFNIGNFIQPITLIDTVRLHFIWNGGGGVEYRYYLHK